MCGNSLDAASWFDDTNPINEDEEYVQAILDDVRWLGFDWQDRLTHASDYFPKLYDFAEDLIHLGKAYVDSQSQESIREQRGTLTKPGIASPFRDRSVAENLELFRRMKSGEFEDGTHVLRAKIDGFPKHQPARSSDLSHPQGDSSANWETSGASTRCTIIRIACLMRLKASPILSALWSLRIIGLSMTGY